MGGCRNYGLFLRTLNIRGRIIMGIQKGPIILTTTQIQLRHRCKLSDYVVRQQLREIAEKMEDGLRLSGFMARREISGANTREIRRKENLTQ